MASTFTLRRIARKPSYTIGRLYCDSTYLCDTIEDCDRGLSQSMPLQTIKSKKIHGATAIPTGTYEVVYTFSPKYKKNMPRLLNVPGYEGILIHTGNTAADTEGCLIVGRNKVVGKVLESRDTYNNIVLPALKKAWQQSEKVFITIK